MGRVLRRILKTAGLVLGALVCLLAITASVNLVMTLVESARNPAPGRMVDVDGRRMHLYSQGSGSRNIILLSGLGTASPAVDFGPLARDLATDFTVTAVENFGYGWSDRTGKARTSQNIVEETRLALRRAGIPPPYILVAHSISGLYALYYANAYPGEVEAVVGLDPSVPQQAPFMASSTPSRIPGILRALGLVRIALFISPGLVGYNFPGYSGDDRRLIGMMFCWNMGNRSLWSEMINAPANARQLEAARFPNAIPVSLVLSKTSVVQAPKAMRGLDWEQAHRVLVAGNVDGKIFVLEGDHYIHWNNSGQIAAIIRETVRTRPAELKGRSTGARSPYSGFVRPTSRSLNPASL